LGSSGYASGIVGLGCMSIGGSYGPADEQEAVRLVRAALDLGVTMFDTADVYGSGESERILGAALTGHRKRAIVATKGGIVRQAGASVRERGVDNSPAYLRNAVEASLRRLRIEQIDIYYIHRRDQSVPIEDAVGTLTELSAEGKIKAIGLCEVTPATLHRAARVAPIATLQSEYSLWARGPEAGPLAACRETGTTFVAFSPLGRGFLTGTLTSDQQFNAGDVRLISPRFESENMRRNNEALAAFKNLAVRVGCTPAQLALAWVLSRSPRLVTIPGTKRIKYLQENVAAADVAIDSAILAEIEEILPEGFAAGDRYRPEGLVGVEQ